MLKVQSNETWNNYLQKQKETPWWEASTTYQEEEDHLFITTCFSNIGSCKSWLIDNGCTSHMTYNKEMFTQLSEVNSLKVWIGDDKHIIVRGKGIVVISTCSSTKFILDLLFVLEIHQNLWSINCKGFKVVFVDRSCLIKNAKGKDIFKVIMKGKSFALNPLEEEQITFLAKRNVTDLWHKRLGHYHYHRLL